MKNLTKIFNFAKLAFKIISLSNIRNSKIATLFFIQIKIFSIFKFFYNIIKNIACKL